MKALVLIYAVLVSTFFTLQHAHARSFEMMGIVYYGIPSLDPNPPSLSKTTNAIGYGFTGRLELGPGMLESGFQYVPVGMTTTHGFGTVETRAGYWTLPLLYRFFIYEPFVSIAGGLDYALVGSTTTESANTIPAGLTTGFKSHLGAIVDLELKQDVGQNLSVVLDFRYRLGLSNAIIFDQTTSKIGWFTVGLGILKHLED